MARRALIEQFTDLQITFEEEGSSFHVLSLNTKTMNVELSCTRQDGSTATVTLPFAHLPKKVKQQLRPLR